MYWYYWHSVLRSTAFLPRLERYMYLWTWDVTMHEFPFLGRGVLLHCISILDKIIHSQLCQCLWKVKIFTVYLMNYIIIRSMIQLYLYSNDYTCVFHPFLKSLYIFTTCITRYYSFKNRQTNNVGNLVCMQRYDFNRCKKIKINIKMTQRVPMYYVVHMKTCQQNSA